MPRPMIYDRWLFLTILALVLSGLFMVGSASNHFAMEHGNSPSSLWFKQVAHFLVAFFAMVVALKFPYGRLADGRLLLLLFAACLIGLIVVLTMPSAGGARRWIHLGSVAFQPSELAKIFVVVFTAWVLARHEDEIDDPWAVLMPCLAVVGTLSALIVIEPDLGSAVVLGFVPCVMLFAAGLRWRYIAGLSTIGTTGFLLAVWAEPFRWRRITAFVDPWADPRDTGFQLIQSLVAFGNGGLSGVGLGQGQQKALFLPAAHTDFIYSIVGEELGLLGSLSLLAGFVVLFWRGMRVARRAPSPFAYYLALGLTNLLVLQALLNMCVCVGLLPTTGLPLPFISYGGSSLVASMAAAGLLLNVSRHSS